MDLHDEFDKEPDLESAFAAEPENSQPAVGAGETFVNDAADTLPAGRPIVNALSTGALKVLWPRPGAQLTPQATTQLEAMGERPAQAPEAPSYAQVRDTRAAREAAGEQQNPMAALAGKGTGVALSLLAPLPKASIGGGALGRIGSAGLTSAGYGALNGAVDSKGDLTKGEWGQVARDAIGIDRIKQAAADWKQGNYGRAALDFMGAGALGGGVTGLGLGAALEGGRGMLQKIGISKGRKVLTNGADQLSAREKVPDDAVLEAGRSGVFKPLGTNAGALHRLEGLTSEQGQLYGDIVSRLEARGVQGPRAEALADALVRKGASLETNTMNEALPAEYLNRAQQLIGKAGNAENLGLSQTEDLKRSLQKMAKYGRVEETPLNEVRRDIASTVRQANEDAISRAASGAPEGSEVQKLGDAFVPVKQRLGRLLEAEGAAERGAARGAQRMSGHMPSGLEMVTATAAGHPGAVLAKPAMTLLKNRLPSTIASAAFGLASPDVAPGIARGMTQLVDEADAERERYKTFADWLRAQRGQQ